MLPWIDHSKDAGVICMPVQTPSLVHLCCLFVSSINKIQHTFRPKMHDVHAA